MGFNSGFKGLSHTQLFSCYYLDKICSHTLTNSPIYRAHWLVVALSKGSTTVGTFFAWKRKQRRLPKRRASSKTRRWTQSKKNIMSVRYRVEVTIHLHVFLTLGTQGSEESASRCGSLSPLPTGSGFTCASEPVSMLWTTDISLLWAQGVGLRLLVCWDCGFESRRGHGCLSYVIR